MKILVSGASGLIGSQLTVRLVRAGHKVVRLVRSQFDTTGADTVSWDPTAGKLQATDLNGIDAVVHLAGESIASRWTAARKRRIRSSRVDGTRLLCETLTRVEPIPRVLVSMSAIGFYGDCGTETVDEKSVAGCGFLAEVAAAWEAATEPAHACGIRVAVTRLGMVLTPLGGALGTMLPAFRLGLGGRLGSGDQYVSWISLEDVVAALTFALETEALTGPVNLVAPHVVTNREFTATLSDVLRRPALIPAPTGVLQLVLGREMARELLLASTRVRPARLIDSEFLFTDSDLRTALTRMLT